MWFIVVQTRARRRVSRVALALMLLGAAAHAAAQPVQTQVLVLQSFDRGSLVLDHFTPDFHVELDLRTEQPYLGGAPLEKNEPAVAVDNDFPRVLDNMLQVLPRIGLTIVRSIVDAHGGTIAARNHPDGGATFTVTLRRGEGTA